jgi:CheY-like chemotaxis protein
VQRAARLESLGRLAGGIAHEFNNLLTAITGNLSLMKLNPVVLAAEGDQILEIESGARRARDVSRRLLTFSVGGEPVLSVTDLAGVVQEAAGRAVRGTKAQCSYSIAPGLRPATADPEQVAQAVEIIVRNAAHAMPEGGTVRISLTNVEMASVSHVLPAGSYVQASIADAGEAICAEELQRIFDPFSPTRRDTSGLDLSTAYSIIKKHRGHIEARSEAGLGVVFMLWLPAAGEGKESAPAARGSDPIGELAPAPRVLVMDDEESIRRISSKFLNRLGLESVAVADGSSALREFSAAKESGKPFSLLVFDLSVPEGLGGLATIEAIRKTDSRTPAIVCSGYSSDPVMANFAKFGFQAAVAKPYDVARFRETVKSVLAGH